MKIKPEFKSWGKIPRRQHETITVTEKIDGTNACIIIEEGEVRGVQSRKRLITPTDDNYGFAKWVEYNTLDLLSLDNGYHYGEWAGPGIQKNQLGLTSKTFFLFNSWRFRHKDSRPNCCSVVPTIFTGENTEDNITKAIDELESLGIAKGYEPEGVIIYFHNTRRYEKFTFKLPKGKWTSQRELK